MTGKDDEEDERARLHSSGKQLRKTLKKKRGKESRGEKRRRERQRHGTVRVLRGRGAWDTRIRAGACMARKYTHICVCYTHTHTHIDTITSTSREI